MTATRTLQVVTPPTMAFMMKKKKYKFQVEVSLDELVEVPFVSAVLFAKVRLLDGGNFQEISTREEVKDHKVKWGARFEFPCKMTANASTGVLEPCVLRVSVRKEIKGGRSFLKHGFCDINLAELAGAGQVSRRYLLEGYDTRHRSDNSMLKVTLSMNMLSGDILFKVPSPTTKIPNSVGTTEEIENVVIPDGRTPDDYSSGSLAGSVASGSSGFGSLPKKRPALFNSELLSGANAGIVPNEISEVSTNIVPELEECNDINTLSTGVATVTCGTPDMLGHSRNSSTTSQMSRASGYSTQHSRQSSSGDSAGHIRNPSAGSLALSETGSLDRAKSALERRKRTQEIIDLGTLSGGSQVSGHVEVTRVNPENLIAEIIKSTNLEPEDDAAETSGLQLFIAKDGTAALGSHEVKSQMSSGVQVFKQVVIEEKR